MINFNGTLTSTSENQLYNNRAFLFADAVFETVKVINHKVLFLEDHYFRLMSSMRIMRMEIPMNFTMEFLQEQIAQLTQALHPGENYRVRFTVFRDASGLYLPQDNKVSFLIAAQALENPKYTLGQTPYEVDLYKDFYLSKQLLSTIKTTNRNINTLASIFASENDLQNCLLINESKNVVEATNGNLFMLLDGQLITAPITEGCIAGIIRKQILTQLKDKISVPVVEKPISAFDLQKAEELFITNVIQGIQPITQYRKKSYTTFLAQEITKLLNELAEG